MLNCALTFWLVRISPPGVVHTALELLDFLSLSFFTDFSVTRDSEPPLSSRALIVTGLGFPNEVLNLTKVIGHKSAVFDRLIGRPRIRLANDIVSDSHDWLTQSSSVSKVVVDEDDIELLSLSFVLSSAKISLYSGLPTVSWNFDDKFKSNLSCLTLSEFSILSWPVFQTDISVEMDASSTSPSSGSLMSS